MAKAIFHLSLPFSTILGIVFGSSYGRATTVAIKALPVS